MKAEELIEKYFSGTISAPELCELRTLLKEDRDILRMFLDEIAFSESLENYFAPDNNLDITALLSNEIRNGELSEDELRDYAAAGKEKTEEDIIEQLKNKLNKKDD